MTETQLGAVGYVRVSTRTQAEYGESLKIQTETIEAYSRLKSHNLLRIYTEPGVSGYKSSRPELDRLMAAASNKEFDIIIFHEFSRFARNTADLLTKFKILQDLKIDIVSIKQEINTSGPYGKALLAILSAIDELEREVIRERTHAGIESKLKEKRTFIGHPPFGYMWNKESERLEHHPRESKVYLMIVAYYISGMSMRQIVRKLEAEHVPTRKKNKKWSDIVISHILQNPVYYQRTYTILKKRQPVTYEIEPLITKARFDRIRQRAKEATSNSGRPSKAADSFLLYGQCICALCGTKMSVGYRRKSDRRIYYCSYNTMTLERVKERGRDKKCSLLPVDADEFERIIWWSLMDILTTNPEKTLDAATNAQKWEEKLAQKRNSIESIKAELAILERRSKRIELMLDDDRFDFPEYASKKFAAAQKIQDLQLELTEAEQNILQIEALREREEALYRFSQSSAFRQVYDILNDLPFKMKQRLIAGLLGEKIKVWPLDDPRALEQQNVTWIYDQDVLQNVFGPLLTGTANVSEEFRRHVAQWESATLTR